MERFFIRSLPNPLLPCRVKQKVNPWTVVCSNVRQNTALHIAAREGHVAAVKLLLNRGAELVLNKSDTSFLHEALQSGRKEVVNAVIDNEK